MHRRVPPPWSIRDIGSIWEVRDASGFVIVWVCYEHRNRGGDTVAERLTREEAWRFARAIAKLPVLLGSMPPASAVEDLQAK
jgi:hypothetical protein